MKDTPKVLAILGCLALGLYIIAFVLPFPLAPLAQASQPPDLLDMLGKNDSLVWHYALPLTALFGIYLLSFAVAQRARAQDPIKSATIVISFGIAAAVALALVYPFGASDPFLYIARGRVLGIHGANSMTVPPNWFGDYRTYVPFPSEWAGRASPYGPLWEWTAAGLAWIGKGNLISALVTFKAFNLICYVACTALVYAILQTRGGPILPGLILFAWNPLILVETLANGHNDLYMVLFVLLAVLAWQKQRWPLIIIALGLGALVKYVPILLLLPALIQIKRAAGGKALMRSLFIGGGGTLLLWALLSAPFFPMAQWEVLSQVQRGHNSVMVWLYLAVVEFFPQSSAFSLILGAMALCFSVTYLGLLQVAHKTTLDLPEVLILTLCAWMLFGTMAFGYWYVAWLVPLVALVQNDAWKQAIITFCWSAMLSVVLYHVLPESVETGSLLAVYSITIPFVFLSPLIVWAAWAGHNPDHKTRVPTVRAKYPAGIR